MYFGASGAVGSVISDARLDAEEAERRSGFGTESDELESFRIAGLSSKPELTIGRLVSISGPDLASEDIEIDGQPGALNLDGEQWQVASVVHLYMKGSYWNRPEFEKAELAWRPRLRSVPKSVVVSGWVDDGESDPGQPVSRDELGRLPVRLVFSQPVSQFTSESAATSYYPALKLSPVSLSAGDSHGYVTDHRQQDWCRVQVHTPLLAEVIGFVYRDDRSIKQSVRDITAGMLVRQGADTWRGWIFRPSSANEDDGTAQTEDDTAQTEDGTAQIEDDTAQIEDDTVQTEDDTAQIEYDTAQTEDDTAQTEDDISQTWRKPGKPFPIPNRGPLRKRDPTLTPNGEPIRNTDPTPIPNRGPLRKPDPTLTPNGGPIRKTDPTPIPNRGLLRKTDPTPVPNVGSIRKTDPTPVPNVGSIRKTDPTPIPNVGSIRKTDPTPTPNVGPIRKTNPTPTPNVGPIRKTNPTPTPNVGPIRKTDPTPIPNGGPIRKTDPTPMPSRGSHRKTDPATDPGSPDRSANKPTDRNR